MLTGQEIRGAVKELLAGLFPGEPIYENITPEGYQRPSSLVECVKRRAEFMNPFLVQMEQAVKVTLFVTVDDYGDSQIGELEERQLRLMEALTGLDALPVGDRALDVGALEGETGFDYAEVTFTLTWAEDRRAAEERPLMEDIHFRINLN